jgi:hypothetical protein
MEPAIVAFVCDFVCSAQRPSCGWCFNEKCVDSTSSNCLWILEVRRDSCLFCSPALQSLQLSWLRLFLTCQFFNETALCPSPHLDLNATHYWSVEAPRFQRSLVSSHHGVSMTRAAARTPKAPRTAVHFLLFWDSQQYNILPGSLLTSF